MANKIILPFAKTICINYSGTEKFINYPEKVVVTGSPVRAGFFSGSRQKALEFLKFSDQKPILLITGGGLGSLFLNQLIFQILGKLCE